MGSSQSRNQPKSERVAKHEGKPIQPPIITQIRKPQLITLPRSCETWTVKYQKHAISRVEEQRSSFESRVYENSKLLEKKIKENEERLQQIQLEKIKEEKKIIFEKDNVRTNPSLYSLFNFNSRFKLLREYDVKYFTPQSKRPTLTPQMLEHISHVSRPYPQDGIIIELDGVQILRKDIQTLLNDNWLNDEIINAYMYLIVRRSKQKVYSFNTFFYPKLRDSGYSSVKRWTRKVDIFSHDIILIPIHLGNHWCLSVIDFRLKVVSYYDSLGGSTYGCCKILLNYLKAESNDKKKQDFDEENWSQKDRYSEGIPRQSNGSDCGVFACTYAEYITRGAKFDFNQKDMPYFRKKMIYEITRGKLLE